MPYSVTKLPGEPIVIATLTLPLHLNPDDARAVNDEIARIALTVDGPLYRIGDASALGEIAFSDVLLWVAEQRGAAPGSVLDPQIRSVAVGRLAMSRVAVRKLAQKTGIVMPIFDTLEDALAHVRAEIAAAGTDRPLQQGQAAVNRP